MSRSYENMDFSKYITSGSLLDQLHAVLAQMPKNSPGRHSQDFLRGLARCMPFEVRDSAAALVFSVMEDSNGRCDPVDAFRGMRLPMRNTWVEYSLSTAFKDLAPLRPLWFRRWGSFLPRSRTGEFGQSAW